MKISPADIKRLPSVWRFYEGDQVYVRGWSQSYPGTIRRRLSPWDLCTFSNIEIPAEALQAIRQERIFPHYEVEDYNGSKWIVCQLHLSLSRISE